MTRVPRGKWFCDACTDKLDLSKPNCVCCPVLGGVLREVSFALPCSPLSSPHPPPPPPPYCSPLCPPIIPFIHVSTLPPISLDQTHSAGFRGPVVHSDPPIVCISLSLLENHLTVASCCCFPTALSDLCASSCTAYANLSSCHWPLSLSYTCKCFENVNCSALNTPPACCALLHCI